MYAATNAGSMPAIASARLMYGNLESVGDDRKVQWCLRIWKKICGIAGI